MLPSRRRPPKRLPEEFGSGSKTTGTFLQSKNVGVCTDVFSKHWVAAGGNKRSASDIRSEHRIIAMINWLIEHPDAGYDKCAEALEGIGTTSNSIAQIAAGVKRVARWRSANPGGTPEDCSRELDMLLRRGINFWPTATLWLENGYR